MKTKHQLRRPPTVPSKYKGQWIAWNHSRTKIVASGKDVVDVRDRAQAGGEKDPVLAKVPSGRFIGRAA